MQLEYRISIKIRESSNYLFLHPVDLMLISVGLQVMHLAKYVVRKREQKSETLDVYFYTNRLEIAIE